MPAVDERVRQVALKVDRAKRHVADLDNQVGAFLASSPYRVGTRRDLDSRSLVYYVSHVDRTPDSLSLLAGDAIQNLVSALDHLAYQLVCSDTGDNPPHPRQIYFPIRNSADEYEAQKRQKMAGAHPDTLAAVDALKPYKGGNDALWVLYSLNNIEKHRLLITVGSMFESANLGAHASKLLADFVKADPSNPFHGQEIPILDAFFRPADAMFPLSAGDVLLIDAPDAEPNPRLTFRFDVALYEPKVTAARSLLETLQEMTTAVEGIVTSLVPCLK